MIYGEYMTEKFFEKLGKVSIGKSCICFKKIEYLKVDTVKEILGFLEKRKKAGEVLFGI